MPTNTVLLLSSAEIPVEDLNRILPCDRIYSRSYGANVMYAVCGEFKKDVGPCIQELDGVLQRFDGFHAGMFKTFKDNDLSRWQDKHYKTMFSREEGLFIAFENGRVVPVAERQRRDDDKVPVPPPSLSIDDNNKRIEDLEFELDSAKLKIELLESQLAEQTAENQSLRSDMGKRAMQLMKEWKAPIEEMRLRADMRHHEHVRRLYAALKAAQEGKPPVMGPFGPRDPGAF